MTETRKCNRCDGQGRIAAFGRVGGGLCFGCGGSGAVPACRTPGARVSARYPGWEIAESDGGKSYLLSSPCGARIVVTREGSEWVGRTQDGFTGTVAECVANEVPF